MQITFDNIEGSEEVYLDVLNAICGDCSENGLIDLGCCEATHTGQLKFKDSLFVDIQDRKLVNGREITKMDVFDFLNSCVGKIDVMTALDFIEHLTIEDGNRLIDKMIEHSKKRIIFTPLGEYLVQTGATTPDQHRSGWYPDNFPGWNTIVFPKYHPTLGIGAFFVWHSDNVKEEGERVFHELKEKSWTLNLLNKQ